LRIISNIMFHGTNAKTTKVSPIKSSIQPAASIFLKSILEPDIYLKITTSKDHEKEDYVDTYKDELESI